MTAKLSPVRQQYLQIKRQHPDAILFFRLGDFYETFDEDAEIAARELDLVLTGRNVAKDQRVPMAGVPFHAAEGYIARLIARGFKVALCEQVSNTTVNGLMPREVTRVFTAGTVIEPGMLDAGRNNYLAAVVTEGDRAGMAYADITTGEFAATQVDGQRRLAEELARLRPAELLLPDGQAVAADWSPARAVSRRPAWRFELGKARQTLLDHFDVATLAGFGCEGKPLATRAAGAVLGYLQESQAAAVRQIQRLATYSLDGFMALDAATRRNLELVEPLSGESGASLLSTLDMTVTPMGRRLLRERIGRPLLDLERLQARLDAVEGLAADGLFRAETRVILKKLPDLERLTNRCVAGAATPREVAQLGAALEVVPQIKDLLAAQAPAQGPLAGLAGRLETCPEVAELIRQALADDAPAGLGKPGIIRPGFSAELDGVVNASAHAREWVAGLEPRERKRTGIASLKVGFNKVFGYYIEISHANAKRAPADYVRKQTLTNAERYITPELKEYETLILNAEERILEIERRVFSQVCAQIAAAAGKLLATAQRLARLDVAAGLAEAAGQFDYVRPRLSADTTLEIVNGRHPAVERAATLERFVPNDCRFGPGERIQVITGPNMAGKSTYLRQVALIVLLAQIGSFVPAESAQIGLADRIFTRIGAHDELHAGRSTFMVEMVEAAEILNHAGPQSLLILDEIGRGTSTYDGLSIAWAIIEYLHNHPRLKPRTLFATHYHELTGLADILPLVANYNVAVAEEGDRVVFLHQIVPGGADRSYGIHVAQLAGLPRDVINRAGDILKELERHAPTAAIEPLHLKAAQQMALFPQASPLLEELAALDVSGMTPLEAINQLYEWKRRFAAEA
ncbi:MAG: DNA mismatch repair protein MutS [Candidatus Promineifilaceae bacterium]